MKAKSQLASIKCCVYDGSDIGGMVGREVKV